MQHISVIRAIYDDRFCRMWEFYLATNEAGFRYEDLMVFQVRGLIIRPLADVHSWGNALRRTLQAVKADRLTCTKHYPVIGESFTTVQTRGRYSLQPLCTI